MPPFRDHFAKGADAYQAHRPHYPQALFDFLAEATESCRTAWDCGTGSGQAAEGLAARFARVVATDASIGQLARAPRIAGIDGFGGVRFLAATAELVPLAEGSVDLVAVAQALHWLDLDRFYSEARRVLRPGGVLAAWTYALLEIAPAIDSEVVHFHQEVVGPYWPPRRAHVDARYATLAFPFERIEVPPLAMEAEWTLDHLLGYMSSWSAVLRYRAATGEDPIAAIEPRLRRAWRESGDGRASLTARWPLTVLATRMPSGS